MTYTRHTYDARDAGMRVASPRPPNPLGKMYVSRLSARRYAAEGARRCQRMTIDPKTMIATALTTGAIARTTNTIL